MCCSGRASGAAGSVVIEMGALFIAVEPPQPSRACRIRSRRRENFIAAASTRRSCASVMQRRQRHTGWAAISIEAPTRCRTINSDWSLLFRERLRLTGCPAGPEHQRVKSSWQLVHFPRLSTLTRTFRGDGALQPDFARQCEETEYRRFLTARHPPPSTDSSRSAKAQAGPSRRPKSISRLFKETTPTARPLPSKSGRLHRLRPPTGAPRRSTLLMSTSDRRRNGAARSRTMLERASSQRQFLEHRNDATGVIRSPWRCRTVLVTWPRMCRYLTPRHSALKIHRVECVSRGSAPDRAWVRGPRFKAPGLEEYNDYIATDGAGFQPSWR